MGVNPKHFLHLAQLYRITLQILFTNMSVNYLNINKKSWNNKVETHVNSEFYDMENFMKTQNSLNPIELNLLPNLKGKTVLHLQCHFGQDSISLSKLGAKVVGVDLSDKAISKARELAEELQADAEFICCDVYDLPNHLNQQFDFIFSSYGTIGWLPDINQWASIVSQFLKPKGQFVFVEFHPVVWMFDDDFTHIKYHYSNKEPIQETETGTYAEKNANIEQEFVMWNHGLSEVIGGLIKQSLTITHFSEYDYSPYDCFANTVEVEPKKFRIKNFDDKLPMVYALVASKNLI